MRQFIAEEYPDSRGCLLVTDKKARHLAAVLRVVPGDMLNVRFPGGELQPMTVAQCNKDVLLQIAGEAVCSGQAAPGRTPPRTAIWLFQFVAKPPKMDAIIRQATECGVAAIIPVAGAYCQSGALESAQKKSDNNDNRWNRIITEAREQSGSPVETQVHACLSVQEAVALWEHHVRDCCRSPEESVAVALYERTNGTSSLRQAVTPPRRIRAAALMVGAEGGISPGEIDYMREHGIIPVHFATNILRCETAAVYGLAVLQNELVENDIWQSNE